MARVTYVKKSQKDQGNCRRCGKAIKCGEPYFWFANRIGGSSIRKNYCADHRPRMSDTTTSKMSSVYAARENVDDIVQAASGDWKAYAESLSEALNEAAQTSRDVAEEYRDGVSNMPEGLQQGSIAQESEEKADALDSWADALENAAAELDGFEPDEAGEACTCGHAEEEHASSCKAEGCDCAGYEAELDEQNAIGQINNIVEAVMDELSL